MPLKPNRGFGKKRPTKEALDALFGMYEKNKELKTLVSRFDLDITQVEVSHLTESEREQKINNQKNSNMNKKWKNANEVTNDQLFSSAEFIDLEKNKELEGRFYGQSKSIKNGEETNNCWLLEVSAKSVVVSNEAKEKADEDGNIMVLLPSNVQLTKKMQVIADIKKDTLTLGVDVCIINEGLQKIENVKNPVKVFKVLYE